MRSLEQFYERVPRVRPHSPAAYASALAIVVVATALRLALSPWVDGVQFITFFPAIIITAFVCGIGAGFASVGLSVLAAWVFVFSPGLTWAALVPLLVFAAVGAADVVIIGSLRAAIGRVRELNTASHNSEIRFRSLLEAAPDAMVIVDADGHIALVNARAEQLFGYPRDELLGQPVDMLLPSPVRSRHAVHVAHFFAHPQARAMGEARELYAMHKSGREFPVEISLSPLRTDQGILVSSAIRDISARRRIEADLVAARQAAERGNRAKSDFLAGMSHELRTPLNAVIGFSQLLEMDLERNLTGKQREYVGHILSSGTHLLGLINQVLDLAGIEAGKLPLTIERVGVRQTIDYVQGLVTPLAEAAGLRLGSSQTGGAIAVAADAQRLRQVLINLVSNAIKYNRQGGSVTLTAEPRPGGRIRFAVTDTGPGIPPERQKLLFQPFQRLGAEHSAIEGTGIGLALSRRLVEAMGGEIGFTSKEGDGSTFWVELPAAGEPQRSAAAERAPSAAASP